ncbi:MAG: putative N-acetylmannosamine-6-phosphate 2-epimerase [Streptosporangiales bacterium]|nr:putative N-acetylmannosamine-6-phosphate 2-epimerase [Streptosporangiales bacterium]
MAGVSLEAFRGGLVVSCQAFPGDPMDEPDVLARFSRCAVAGGAVGIRAENPRNVAAIRAAIDVPVIGLWKVGHAGVYITPGVEHARAVVAAGADVVAADATARRRPGHASFAEIVATVHGMGREVLADVATVEEGIAAAAAGADAVSTTLAGYTDGWAAPGEPDLALVADLASKLDVPVVAEGRIAEPEQARLALAAGAYCVVVGAAITRPTWLTARFVRALERT